MQECNAQFELGKDSGSQKDGLPDEVPQFEGGGLRQYEVVILKSLRAGARAFGDDCGPRPDAKVLSAEQIGVDFRTLSCAAPAPHFDETGRRGSLKKSQIE